MKLINKILSKNKTNEYIEIPTFIYQQALSCLKPISKVYCSYYYGNTKKISISFSQIEYNLTTFSLYVVQLIKYQKEIIDKCGLTSAELWKIRELINNLKQDIESDIDDFKALVNYHDSSELQKIVLWLCDAKRSFRNQHYSTSVTPVESIKML